MAPIKSYKQFDFNNIKYSEPKINKMGGQTVFVNDMGKEKIRICTPKCTIPFGLSEYNGRYSIQMSLNTNTTEFIDFLQKFDNNNIENGSRNSTSWFKKQMSVDTLQQLYNHTPKQSNPKYPPMFKAKMQFKDGSFEGEIFDTNRRKLNIQDIKPGSHVEAIVELTGIYFLAKDFGMSWKVIQLKVHPSEKISGYAFADDSDDEDSDAEPV